MSRPRRPSNTRMPACEKKIQRKKKSNVSLVTQLSNLSPTETPDNISFRSSNEEDDLFYGTPKLTFSLLHSMLATILCLPIGCIALNNVYKMSNHLRDGRKTRARKHALFAASLSNFALVVGTLFWSIAIVVTIVHGIILKKENT